MGTAEQLKQIFSEQPLLGKQYKKICVTWSGTESALLPEELYHPGENSDLLDSLYGDLEESSVATDLVAEKKIFNVYRMPAAVHRAITDQFPLAAFSHKYSVLVKEPQAEGLQLVFYTDCFISSLVRSGELQHIHSWPYQSATDVVYHLGNLEKQFGAAEAGVRLSGMIQEGGDLHREIIHYFPGAAFDEMPAGFTYSPGIRELPSHYFSHLFSLASCV